MSFDLVKKRKIKLGRRAESFNLDELAGKNKCECTHRVEILILFFYLLQQPFPSVQDVVFLFLTGLF